MDRSKTRCSSPAGQPVGLEGGEIGFGGDRAEQQVRPLESDRAGQSGGRARELPTLAQVRTRYYGRKRSTIALCPNYPRSKP